MELILNILSAISALIAAYLWVKSAWVFIPSISIESKYPIYIPGTIPYEQMYPNLELEKELIRIGEGKVSVGNAVLGPNFANEVNSLTASLKKQSGLSGQAAIAAGIAAGFQVGVILIHLFAITPSPQ